MTDTIKISRELAEQICVELEHDNDRYMLGRELRKALATPPADAADMGGQAEEGVEVVAHLMRPDFMEPYVSIRRDCSGVFVEQLMTVAQHLRILAQHRQQAGKLAEALRKLTAAMACHDSTPEEYNALAGAREALADWEKTSCGK